MNKIISTFIFLLLFPCRLFPQYFTIHDVEIEIYRSLRPENLEMLQWKGNSHDLIYVNDDTVWEINGKNQQKTILASLSDFNRSLKTEKSDTLENLLSLTTTSDELVAADENEVIYYDPAQKLVTDKFAFPDSSENFLFNDIPGDISYTIGNNVWIRTKDQPARQITFDSLDGIVNGNIVYRQEFGIDKGMFWSPEGNYLAYYRKDERGVSRYPLVDIHARVAKVKYIRYPMAGMKSEETEIWVYSMRSGKSLKLDIEGDPEQYNTNITWSPDEKYIYIQQLNRGQDTMALKKFSAIDGSFQKTLFTETDKDYVQPLFPLTFLNNSNTDFIYQSERDGYNHLYLYHAATRSLQRITQGPWEVTKLIGISPDDRHIFFMATKDGPKQSNLYDLDMKTDKITRQTTIAGTHSVTMSDDKTEFTDNFSSRQIPREIDLVHAGTLKKSILLKADNPLKNFELGQEVDGTIKAADDTTTLYYRLIKPVNFDPSKKYPVIIYVYGGPMVQLLTDSWMDRIDYFQQYLAQHGYVGFILDPRGSDNRGRAFEQVIFRQTGIPQLADEMKGVEFLKSLPYVDSTRIGVNGWSYGGYMTIQMMLKEPGVFKVGVAGGPVIDWKYYEVMYGERYMDTPQENPKGYALTDLNNYAGNLQGKLLIIQGAMDPIVVWQHSLSFLDACIKANKQLDYFVYPSHEHNVVGIDRVNLSTKIADYFFRNL